MVKLENKINNLPPEERIEILKRLKELEEEKIKRLEEKKEKEIKELKKKAKDLEDEVGEEIKDSIEELTEIEAKKREQDNKRKFFEERLIKLSADPQSINYNNLVNSINSGETGDLRNAYNDIKEMISVKDAGVQQRYFDYASLKKIKTVVDSMKEDEDDFGYIKRMKTLLNKRFDNQQNYTGY